MNSLGLGESKEGREARSERDASEVNFASHLLSIYVLTFRLSCLLDVLARKEKRECLSVCAQSGGKYTAMLQDFTPIFVVGAELSGPMGRLHLLA